MADIIKLPKMSDTMEEGVIVKWNVKLGDIVKSGDILADVETDKATMELENFSKGTILELLAKEGEAIPVNGVIAVIGTPGETYQLNTANITAQKPEAKVDKAIELTSNVEIKSSNNNDSNRLKVSPLAKKLAIEKGLDINTIQGSGENGRIVKRDIENQNNNTSNISTSNLSESYTEVNVSQMRKTIANRLAESKFTAPHFYLTMEINMDNLMAAREKINAYSEVKISVNDIIIKACSISLQKHPNVNSSWLGTKIRTNHHISIGVAMAVEDGLLVPVVKYANTKTLSQISSEVKTFSELAKTKKLQPSDWQGNTFTISNLGMFGIDEFTAIINPPDACILAVGGVKDIVGIINGEIKATKVMKVTLSCDHRVVDGVVGSKFLQTLKTLIEDPIKLLV